MRVRKNSSYCFYHIYYLFIVFKFLPLLTLTI